MSRKHRQEKQRNAEQYKKYGEIRQKMWENAKEKRGNKAENVGECERNAGK